MTVSLGEEIMLLSLDDETGAAKGESAARWGVAAGMLLELVMAGRVTVKGGRVEVFDPTPDRRRPAGRPPRPAHALGPRDLQQPQGRRLADPGPRQGLPGRRGQPRRPRPGDRGEAPGPRGLPGAPLPGGRRNGRAGAACAGWPPWCWVEPGRTPAPARSSPSCTPRACTARPSPDLPKKQVAPRMVEIAEGHWAGVSVGEAIRDLQAAISAVTVVTVLSAVP